MRFDIAEGYSGRGEPSNKPLEGYCLAKRFDSGGFSKSLR